MSLAVAGLLDFQSVARSVEMCGSDVMRDEDDDDDDDDDDSKLQSLSGVDPDRLKAFNVRI